MRISKLGRGMQLAAAAMFGVLVSLAPAAAEDYPSRPVRLIVPYAPGGATDTMARIVGQKLSEALKQPFIVENRPGASSMIGTDAVAKAAPDGYTLLTAGSTLATNSLILKDKVPYKLTDLTPVGPIAKTPMAIEVNPSVPAKDFKEFVAYAKANPGKLNYGTFGKGTIPHLTCELVSQVAGIKMTDVSYKGAAPVMNDLLSGTLQVFCDVATTSVPLHRSGKARVLGLLNETRVPFAADLPTLAELGYPDLIASTTFALLAPAGTPKPVVDKLGAELDKIVRSPDFAERLQSLGSVPLTGNSADYAKYLQNEHDRWEKVVRNLDLTEK